MGASSSRVTSFNPRRNLITVFLGGAPAALPPNFNVGLDFRAEPQNEISTKNANIEIGG